MVQALTPLLLRWLVLALGVTVATKIIPGIRCDDFSTLVAVVLVLSFLNTLLKPLLVLVTLPFILLTMGLGMVLINALLFLVVSRLIEGFVVESFWSAVGGAIVIGVTNLFLSNLTKPRPPKGPRPPFSGGAPRKEKGGDVIDI